MTWQRCAVNPVRAGAAVLLLLLAGCGSPPVVPTCSDKGCSPGCDVSDTWVLEGKPYVFTKTMMPAHSSDGGQINTNVQCISSGSGKGHGKIEKFQYKQYDKATNVQCPSAWWSIGSKADGAQYLDQDWKAGYQNCCYD